MGLTRKTEYALIAACYLAREPARVVSAREIAARFGVPPALLMNVLKSLQQAGVVKSERGARGGYELAMPAAAVSLATLVQAIEGPARLVRCAAPEDENAGCDFICHCPVRQPMIRLHERFADFLRGVTVADIAFDDGFATEPSPLQPLRVLAQ